MVSHKNVIRAVGALFLGGSLWVSAQVVINIERNVEADANAGFKFRSVPQPAKNDAASNAVITLVDGQLDRNGGGLSRLNDGRVPTEEDAPADNLFLAQSTDGGRLLMDLGQVIAIKQINTYSWHGGTRAPQVYRVFASDGTAADFNPQPKRGTEPASCGWNLIASVDSRPKTADFGGQFGVSISDLAGTLGRYRYLLFDVNRTEDRDPFGNTFFSEIDVLDVNGPTPQPVEASQGALLEVAIEGGKYRATLDTSLTPELNEWVQQQIVPMIQEWYPKLVKMLPSEGFEAPARFSVVFDPKMQGVAATGGTRIRCAAAWFRQNLRGEAKGALFHEMVHVVQQYGRAPRNPGAVRPPVWLTEGITDYIRFFLFEPEVKGAEITARNLSRARYDGSYRITGNFLNWLSEKHGKDFVPKLNAIIREGKYNEDTWKQLAGSPVADLGDAWKKELEKRLGVGQ